MKSPKRKVNAYRYTATVIILSTICLFCCCSHFNDDDLAYKATTIPSCISDKSQSMKECSVLFNADVIIPETEEYSIIEAKMRFFSDNDILYYIELLTGLNGNLYSSWELSKTDWRRRLLWAKQDNDDEKTPSYIIAYLQEQIEQAPLFVDKYTQTIKEFPYNALARGYLETGSSDVAMFTFIRGGNTFTYLRNYDDLIMGKGLLESNQNSIENVNMQEYYDWLIPDKPDISYEEAYSLSQHYLQAMGIDLELYYSEPCTVVRQRAKKSIGWVFTFTRNYSGLQAQFFDGQWVYINPDAPPAVGAPWNQEVCIMAFDKDGLCKLWWQGAASTSKCESVDLEEFGDIKSSINQQLYQMYGTHKNGVGVGLDIVVEKIELGICLIATNNLVHYGEYIPTWYVNYKYKWRSDKDTDNLWSAGQIMFSGVDGRYIEPRVLDRTICSLKE